MNGEKILCGILDTYGINYVTEYRFHSKRRWRFDIAIIERKIAFEYDGLRFNRGKLVGHGSIKQMQSDREKSNAALLLGWSVYRFMPQHFRSLKSGDLPGSHVIDVMVSLFGGVHERAKS